MSFLSHRIYILYFFFFFQAEDGIRDPLVTGVQTCALPIWLGRLRQVRPPDGTSTRYAYDTGGRLAGVISLDGARRSEERRVGKEGRSRGVEWEEIEGSMHIVCEHILV